MAQQLWSKLKNSAKSQCRRALNTRGYLLSNYSSAMYMSILHLYVQRCSKLVFVQIGGNDGISWDPLYDFVTANHKKVSGLVLEPVVDYYVELCRNYRKYPSITPVNRAIHASQKSMTIYKVDPGRISQLPDGAKGIASFNKDHYRHAKIPNDCIVEETVKCLSFKQLLDEHNLQRLDLLQIDTEGYDFEILKQIDFEYVKPNIIRFEHNVSYGVMSKQHLRESTDLLHQHGYEVIVDPHDATAIQTDLLAEF